MRYLNSLLLIALGLSLGYNYHQYKFYTELEPRLQRMSNDVKIVEEMLGQREILLFNLAQKLEMQENELRQFKAYKTVKILIKEE